MKREVDLVKTPNNIVKGTIDIDSQINKLYYQIMKNIQKQNRDLIIKATKKGILTEKQELIKQKLDDLETLKCKITTEEITNIIRRRNEQTTEAIMDKFIGLQTAVFRFTTGEQSSRQTQLIGAVDTVEGGYIVNVDAKLYRYLFYNLEVGHTPVNLCTLFNLKSQYSQKLYMLLRSWTAVKTEIKFTVAELRDLLNLGTKYPAYRNFNQRVIEGAVKEINSSGSMEIKEVKEEKKGRSVVALTFVVKDLEPRFVLTEKTDLEVKDKPTEWLEGITVANQKIANALQAKYGDITEGIGKYILQNAFYKTLSTDKNGEQLITRLNLKLFMTIADGELETNRLYAESSLEPSDIPEDDFDVDGFIERFNAKYMNGGA